MAVVGIRELKAKASQIVDQAASGEAFVLTKRGRPVAVMLPLPEDVEDLILAQGKEFARMRDKAREEYARGETASWSDVRQELKD